MRIVRSKSERSRVNWNLKASVYSFTPEGMEKLKLLREEYPDNRINPEYIKASQRIRLRIEELKALSVDTLHRVQDIKDQREALKALSKLFPARRQIPEYIEKYSTLLEDFGFQKKRVTWNWKVYWSIFLCALHGELEIAKQMFVYEMGYTHNIVTDEGDALIADHMSETDARTLVDVTNGHVEVGTGWTGVTPKQNLLCNTSVAVEVMDATYPQLKGAWGVADDNVVQYRATFEAGEAQATDLDEAALLNNITPASADCLAYGEITPKVTVGASDTLQVDWEHTYLGA